MIDSACLGSHDLNYSNRPVRTRMPGGVGGDRSGFLTAPIPIVDETGDSSRVPQDNGGCPQLHTRNAMNLTTPALLFPAISLLWTE